MKTSIHYFLLICLVINQYGKIENWEMYLQTKNLSRKRWLGWIPRKLNGKVKFTILKEVASRSTFMFTDMWRFFSNYITLNRGSNNDNYDVRLKTTNINKRRHCCQTTITLTEKSWILQLSYHKREENWFILVEWKTIFSLEIKYILIKIVPEL